MAELDPERLRDYSKRLFGLLGGAVTSVLVSLGDALGLYRALSEGGPASSIELAERTGLSERWLREWLYNQAAAGLIERLAEQRFALSAEGCAVLAEERHPACGVGLFAQLPATLAVVDRLQESFRSGVGLPYDAFGPEGARGIERGFTPWLQNFMLESVVGSVDGLRQRLEAGARVADVGCGTGSALFELAQAFPRCELHGYELSQHALRRAEQRRAERGLANVCFHDVGEDPLPERADFDLVLCFDCLHDMTRPQEAARAIRRALSREGLWLVAEVKALPSFEENLERNPMCTLMYGLSVLTCMSSALSEPGGAGLGTLGLPEVRLRELALEAGFGRLERLDVEHPVNAFYAIRA